MTTFERHQRQQWIYHIFGPTTLHLQHEFYMWISLSLLTLATLKSLYRQALYRGDVLLVLIVSMWLSRHFVLRWLVTNDTSTAKNPTLLGVIMYWITSYVMAGQYAERLIIPSDEDYSLWPSFSYTLYYLRTRIWYPFKSLNETEEPHQRQNQAQSSPIRRRSSTSSASPPTWKTSYYFQWITWWRDRGPSIQMMLHALVSMICLFDFVTDWYPRPSSSGAQGDDIAPLGVYRDSEPLSRYKLLLFLARTPTLLTALWYGRIVLPIPDLVAGMNVLKSVRAEALLNGQGSSTSSSGKSSKVKQQIVKEDASWAEEYKSIAVENRFRLAWKVAAIRVVDGLLACTILPRTSLACRLTGHCPERPPLWELASILNPIGLTGPRPTHTSTLLRSIIPDQGTLVIITLSVILITFLLLLAQQIVLNGSFLAIMGYVSGEWTLVEDAPEKYFEAPANWDPRRRYKKGDLIMHPGFGGGRVYRASTNNPEGRPFDLCLRVAHNVFRNELGHASTSRVISTCILVEMAFICVIVGTIISYFTFLDYATGGLCIALLANLVACYGTVSVGMMDYEELANVANEIRPLN